jgi:hypothetical protein
MFQTTKSLSILLILLGLISAGCRANSTAEEERTEEEAVVEVVNPPEPISSGTVTASLLNIHDAPGTNTPILYEAPAGTEVDIFDETALGDSIWYQVKARSDELPQELGWAFSRYVDTGENGEQNYPSADNQPSAPPTGGGSGSAGGSGGLDPEAPGANPDTPGGLDPEAPGANPDTPGGLDPEAPGANPDIPGGVDPEAPGANRPDNPGGSGGYPGESTGGSGGYPGEDTSRPSTSEDNSRPATSDE